MDDNIELTLDKMRDLLNYSNPTAVRRKLKKIYGKDMELYMSNRPSKKYMIYHPQTNKKIHFGAMGYRDATIKDKDRDERRRRFLIRNAKWSEGDDPFKPSWLAYHLLW
jgi:hypothetical protein